jgi:hypothetical protein
MFAIVDRTNLQLVATTSQSAVQLPPRRSTAPATVIPVSMSGSTTTGRPWSIQVGSLLTVDSGANQETVRVIATTPTSFTAVFARPHPSGFGIVVRGNPGPRSHYNPADDPEVVPYYSIIK